MMKTELLVNGLEVVETNVALVTGKDPVLVIKIDTGASSTFDIKFTFTDELSNINPHVKANVDGNELIIDCINFNNPLGSGMLSQADIGTIAGKKIYLSYWINSCGNPSNGKLIHYTLLRER